MKQRSLLTGHLCMMGASTMWGLMAPLGKDAMANGISGLEMICFRVTGGSICFWLASFVVLLLNRDKGAEQTKERITPKDSALLFGAALFAIVFNQCNYIIGLSITSPLNASIMTTIMPIFTMILATIVLKEPLTSKKFLGVILGACGAATLILASANGVASGGVLKGDLMCVAAQFSYSIYLTAFKSVIQKFTAITCMKWMMTFAALVVVPFGIPQFMELDWASIGNKTWAETAFVVVGGTFFSFLLSTNAQKVLRPTVVAMYNYMQPIIACMVSVLIGVGIFGWNQLVAIVLVFSGVYLVNKSKAKDDGQACK